MTKLFAVQLEPHSDIELLFAAPTGDGATAYGAIDEIVERSSETLSGALDMVRSVAICARDKLADLDVAGAEATIGLKLSGKGKFIVAEAAAEATLNIKITLKR